MRLSRRWDIIFGNALIFASIVGIVMIVVLFSHEHAKRAAEDCAVSVGSVSAAKWRWAEEHEAARFPERIVAYAPGRPVVMRDAPVIITNVEPTWADLRPYYDPWPATWPSNAPAPRCPGGGKWKIGRLSEIPTCSIKSHVAAFRRLVQEQEEKKRTAGIWPGRAAVTDISNIP